MTGIMGLKENTDALTILFADITQSTRLYETLGDQAAQRLISVCLQRLTEIVTRHEGTVIKTIGDEVLCTFGSPPAAVDAAREMHKALDDRIPDEGGPISLPNLHVGVHTGPVILKQGDVYGDTVNIAARLVKLAKQRQIITSKDVVQEMGPPQKASVRFLGRMPVRGKKMELPVYEVVWEDCDMTVIAEHALISQASLSAMNLRVGAEIIQVNASRPSVTMGRQEENDIVLKGSHISRSHARLECRAGRFLLSDMSSNGTYVVFQDGEMVYLRGDQVVLHGSGLISPGLKPGAGGVIKFKEQT